LTIFELFAIFIFVQLGKLSKKDSLRRRLIDQEDETSRNVADNEREGTTITQTGGRNDEGILCIVNN
jgi:hypothetical protein